MNREHAEQGDQLQSFWKFFNALHDSSTFWSIPSNNAQSLMSSNLSTMESSDINVAQYLFSRLRQLGIRSLHGVPGDYNLELLDHVKPFGLIWVGNANELNAGYAADGYGRVRGISCLVTAFGVGELSAINAVAGAYAERSAMVHIVGAPSTTDQDNRLCLHHSLGDGDFRVFASMYAKITVAQANLSDPATAPAEIDRVLHRCIDQSRPVYLEIPSNMVAEKVPAASLSRAIKPSPLLNDKEYEDAKVAIILNMIYTARQPFIIVDGFARPYRIQSEVDDLVRVTGFPTTTTMFGKGVVDETYDNVYGIYAGGAGDNEYSSWVKSCDLVIWIAPLMSDTNTFKFSTLSDPSITLAFHRDSVKINGQEYPNLSIKPLLRSLINCLDMQRLPPLGPGPNVGRPSEKRRGLLPSKSEDSIDQKTFWLRSSHFLCTGDIVLVECGTSVFGAQELVLPPNTMMITSSLWLSIGFMLGAAQGAALALREMIAADKRPGGRCILFTGDGGLQMSVQAISDIIRNRLDVTIFVLNNSGYTIERYIHGMHAEYNDVQPWRYLEAPSFFGAAVDDPVYPVLTRRAANWGQMNELLDDPCVKAGQGLIMIEVVMKRADAPEVLKNLFPR